MQYDEPVPQGKPNSYREVTFSWTNVSGFYFNVMNTLLEFSSSSV